MQYIRGDKIFYHRELFDFLDEAEVSPITLELHLSNRCNMRCGYCFFDDRDKQLELDSLDAINIINQLN